MADPELTRERFLILAEQAGFDPSDPHLDDLFQDVRLMFERLAVLRGISVDEGIEPVLRDEEA
ncbi:MAG: hypothetical protein J4N31_00565 [Chloroflexi bacterium]|nr:hypothetical protein [Chloroflexota bacterium]MCI0820810.1 hypothetical protein [Chloroflexota bacterium]